MGPAQELETIGKYKVLRRLSEGASGVVYLVEASGNQYALKLLKSVDADTLVRFRRESSTLARLNHKSLLKIYDVGELNGAPYLVMEYLEGNSLAGTISADLRISVEKSVEIVGHVASGLSEIHKSGLVHRDVKPANIFVTSRGTVKLIDFGLVDRVEQIKSESALVGTPLYCSPEQSRVLKRNVDFRSDLYSLGVTFFEMLTGRPPFEGSLNELLHLHASRAAPDVRDLNANVRPAVAAIVAKLVSKDPDDRYQSARGLWSDLQRLDEIDSEIRRGVAPKLGVNDRKTLTTRVKCVARQTESRKLCDAWERVSSGRPSLQVVTGASGAGKTRICEEFLDSIQAQNSPLVLRSKCQFFDRDLPFGPIREAIDGLLDGILSAEDETFKADAQGKLTKAAAGHEEQLISISKSFSKLFPGAKSQDESIRSSDTGRELFFNSVSEFFVRLCDAWGSVIFFVDDLQWIDQASRQLFLRIFGSARQSRFFLLGTARDDVDSRSHVQVIVEGLADYKLDDVYIDVFSQNEVASLIGEYLGTSEVDQSIVAAIHQRSKGNALIAIEYLRAGIEQGYLTFGAGRWELNREELDKITFSEDVYSLILKRIEKSSALSKEFLQYAALYGNSFRASEIAAAARMEPGGLEDILQACADLALIEMVGPSRWKFVHDKVPESIINSLPTDKVREMSDRLARWLCCKAEKSADEIFVVARLFRRGNVERNLVDAIRSFAEAGDQAFANFAHGEGYSYYVLANDLSEKHSILHEERLRLAPKLAICATLIGDEKVALRCADLCIKSAKSDGQLAHATALKVWILTNRSQIAAAWEYFKETSSLIGRPYPLYVLSKSLQIIWTWTATLVAEFTGIRIPASWFFKPGTMGAAEASKMHRDALICAELRGNQVDLVLTCLKLLQIGQVGGKLTERAVGYAAAGFAYATFGLKSLARFYFDRASACCEALQDPTVTAYCEMRRLLGSFYGGLIQDYDQEYAERRDLLSKYLSPAEHGRLISYNGVIDGFKGRYSKAVDLLLRAVEASDQKIIPLPPHTTVVMLNQAWSQLQLLGRLQESQKIKTIALSRNYEYRHSPSIVRSVLNAEVGIRRVTKELNQETEEIIGGFWKRRANKFADPTVNNFAALMTYIRLYQFEAARSDEERFSARLEFKAMMRHLFLTLYCPLFRANYLFLKGSYFRAVGKPSLAEFYYRRAERMASRSGALLVLFDIQRDRALIYKKSGHLELMRMALSSAMKLALENGWTASVEVLVNEFPEDVPMLSQLERGAEAESRTRVSSIPTASSRSVIRNTMVARSPAAETQLQKSVVGATATQGMRSGLFESGWTAESRLAEVLLSVSAAFISSADPTEQSKAVLSQIIRLFAAERGFIFLLEEDRSKLRVSAGLDSTGADLMELQGYSGTVVRKSIEELRPIVVTGTDEGEALGSESAVLHNLRSIMATPLKVEGRTLGAVYLDSSLTKGLFTHEDVETFATLANHIAVAYEMARIGHVEAERRALEKDLLVAAAVQTFFLPKQDRFSTDRVSLIGHYYPASQASGDWWWYKYSDVEDRLTVLLGDVTGHGAASAMMTASTAGAFQTLVRRCGESEISGIMCELNSQFLEFARGKFSMTMGAVQIDSKRGKLTFHNAAGPAIYILGREGSVRSVLPRSSVPLGSEDFLLGTREVDLVPGDRVCMLTDGVTEMVLADGSQLRAVRFSRILQKTQGMEQADASEYVIGELSKLRDKTPLADDMTMVLLDYEWS